MRLDYLGRKIVVKMTFELLDEKTQQLQAVIKMINMNCLNHFKLQFYSLRFYEVSEECKFTYYNNVGENSF